MSKARRFTNLRRLMNGERLETEEQQELESEAENEEEVEEEVEEEAEEEAETEASEQRPGFEAYDEGVAAERQRWAEVLCSDEADGKFDLAVDMLAEDLDAGAIKRILSGQGKKNTVASRLKKTPKKGVGGNAPSSESEEEGASQAAKEASESAVKATNRGRRGTMSPKRKLQPKEE